MVKWRDRYGKSGMDGLGDAARSGVTPAEIDEVAVIAETLADRENLLPNSGCRTGRRDWPTG